MEEEGHETLYSDKGRNGHLNVKVKVKQDQHLKREGVDIISHHSMTLTEALLGADIKVHTIDGETTVRVGPANFENESKIVLKGKGIFDRDKGRGNHVAELSLNIPRDLNAECLKLIQEFARDERPVNFFDQNAQT